MFSVLIIILQTDRRGSAEPPSQMAPTSSIEECSSYHFYNNGEPQFQAAAKIFTPNNFSYVERLRNKREKGLCVL